MLSQLGQTLLPSYLTIMKKPTAAEALIASTTTAATTTSTIAAAAATTTSSTTSTTTTDDTDDATDMRGKITDLAYESSYTNSSSSMLINLDIGSIDVNEAINNVSLVWNKTSFSLLKQLLRVGVIIGLINLTLCQLLRRYFYKV